jgi:hypothetical protein
LLVGQENWHIKHGPPQIALASQHNADRFATARALLQVGEIDAAGAADQVATVDPIPA